MQSWKPKSRCDLPIIQPYGESALLIIYDEKIDPFSNLKVMQLDGWLQEDPIAGLLETVPAYASLLVLYDPLQLRLEKALDWITVKVKSCPHEHFKQSDLVEVPVFYGGAVGMDLAAIADQHGISVDEVIQWHSRVEYTVAMMGFTPGFVYLSGMDKRLVTPRLATPRKNVPAGAVGIAGSQTGIYSIDSPGGWQLIGWTPLVLFDQGREDPFMFEPGNRIRFIPQ